MGCKKISQNNAELAVDLILKKLNYKLMENFKYVGAQYTILKLQCNNGHFFNKRYSSFVSKSDNPYCQKCGRKNSANKHLLNQLDIDKNISNKCEQFNITLSENFKYVGSVDTKLKLKCNICNYEWETSYMAFIQSNNGKTGCTRCTNKAKLTQEEAEERVNKRCSDINYELIGNFEYNGAKHTKLKLKCDNNHIFQTTYEIFILSKSACSFCKSSKIENKIKNLLEINNINFIRQYSPKLLDNQKLDFYLTDYNIGIECQGRQHFIPTSFGSDKSDNYKTIQFNYINSLDRIKFFRCKINNIHVLYFADEIYEKYFENNIIYLDNIYVNENQLLNKIDDVKFPLTLPTTKY